jgi:endoglucanase
VVDASTEQHITTSEGQSYGLFFALIANDREAFANILRWTQNNLAQGDLTRALPAWQWGRTADGNWRVLDANAASDADVWIAYALGEAGRLWNVPSYTALGRELARRILREEVSLVPKLGATLLPGPKGFVQQQTWRLNASYAPLQVLHGLKRQSGDALWNEVVKTSEQVILASAPRGFAADWIEYRVPGGFAADRATRGIGSYNAIRVYLWAGMLPSSDAAQARLSKKLTPMVADAAQRVAPAEEVDTQTLTMKGEGSPGFSAALLPMLANAKQTAALQAHRARVQAQLLKDDQAYYSNVLSLFGLGWMEGRYRFEAAGLLTVRWTQTCE